MKTIIEEYGSALLSAAVIVIIILVYKLICGNVVFSEPIDISGIIGGITSGI